MRRRDFLVGASSLPLVAACGQVFDAEPLRGQPEIAFEDRMPAFFRFWEQNADAGAESLRARFEAEVVRMDAGLYTPAVLGERHLETQLDAWLARVPAELPAMRARHADFVSNREAIEERFTSSLPDFDWRGRVVLYPSVGAFVGAARMVDGQPAVLLGLDTAAFEQRPLALALHHELFHMYQVPGGQNIAEALWVEGLATFAALALSPGHPDADALPASKLDGAPVTLPNVMPSRVAEVGPHLRAALRTPTASGTEYATFFSPTERTAGLPSRSGFWFALALVRRLARGRSLRELAALEPSSVADSLQAQLDAMIAGG